jgi:hypothetical protein
MILHNREILMTISDADLDKRAQAVIEGRAQTIGALRRIVTKKKTHWSVEDKK